MHFGFDQAGDALHRVLYREPEETPRQSSPPAPVRAFRTEAEMLPQLRVAATSIWVDGAPTETWVLLEEQILHSRIADLVLVRIDVEAVRVRVEGGWLRPLRLNELRALDGLRADRGTSVHAVARRMRVEPASAGQVLGGLTRDGFIARDASASYRRLASVSAIAQRVVSFEAKREDPRGALLQARAHRAWANETYVACDATFCKRFDALRAQYASLGIGLFELSPSDWRRVLRSKPQRRANRLEASLIGERALARLLGEPGRDRPERRLPHGRRLSAESEPVIAGPDAAWLSHLRGDAALTR